ncbi:MAG TPA: hypothetical protein VGR30_11450 [Candidatus Binatia bacterium]|jgi:hypothetical protein|nr:hypothetical protein [Candidatus Binatia bacterium]
MRKKIINQTSERISAAGQKWLDLGALAQVEVTSESAAHPIEAALIPSAGSGWHAEQPGEQTIRIIFDKPLSLRRILLMFQEEEQARTQEFVLRWFREGEESSRDIMRQQYNFSPPGATREIEDQRVELNGVTALELRIVPDISGGSARASLAQMRIG